MFTRRLSLWSVSHRPISSRVTRRCVIRLIMHPIPSNEPLFPLSDIPPSDPCPICDKENLIKKERKRKERAMDSCQRQSTTSRITRWRFLEEREMGAKAVAKVVAHSKLVARHSNKDFALSMTAFLMKIVGLWLAKNEQEQRKRRLTLMYTVIAILFGVWVQFRDFYYSWPNFGVSNKFLSNF